MFDRLKNLFRNKVVEPLKENEKKEIKYCRFLNAGITFMHSSIRPCCSNKCGIMFVDNYKGEDIDWKNVEKKRQEIIKESKKGILPQNCEDCVELQKVEHWPENKLIEYIYLNHFDHCNCGCVYCINLGHASFLETEKRPSQYYSSFKEIKKLLDKNMVAKNAHIEIIGGDLSVLDESDDIINACIEYGIQGYDFHSSCISYSQGIENALKSDAVVKIDFSLDCGTREKYKKIKRVDAFDQVIENIKKYISFSKPGKDTFVAKYIIVDGLNDNIEDLNNWIELINSLGIKEVRIDVNFLKYFSECNPKEVTVPDIYYKMYEHFSKKVAEYGMHDCCWEFPKRVLKEGRRPKGY